MQKKYIIIISFIVIILLALGLIFRDKIATTFSIEKKYSTLEKIEKKEVIELDSSKFIQLSKKIGFEDASCDELSCKAQNETKKNIDSLYMTLKDGKTNEIYLSLTEGENGFSAEKITKKINTILNNFYGSELDKEYVEEKIELVNLKSKSNPENAYIEEYKINEKNVVMFALEYYEKNYTIKSWVITKETYNEIKSAEAS